MNNKRIHFFLFLFIYLLVPIFSTASLTSFEIEKGEKISEKVDELNFKKDSIRSNELYNLGIEEGRNGNTQLALNNFLECLSIRERIFPPNHLRIASVCIGIGIQYKNLGKFQEAINSYLRAEQIYISNYGPNYSKLGPVYSNIGNINKQKGNFTDALKYHQQALINSSYDAEFYKDEIPDIKFNIAESYYASRRYAEALDFILKNYKDTPPRIKGDFFNLLANVYVALNEYSKADEYFNLSIEAKKKAIDSGEEKINLANFYLSYSQFLISQNDYAKAEIFIRFAEPIIIDYSGKKGIDPSELYFTLGELYSKKNVDSHSLSEFRSKKSENLEAALDFFQDALIAVCENFTNKSIESNPGIGQCKFQSQSLKILQSKSAAFYQLAQMENEANEKKLNNLTLSLNSISIASDLLQNVRTGTVSEESKLFISKLQNSTFLNSVNIAFELYNLTGKQQYFETAFQNAERNKAASLLDNLTDQNARQVSLLPDSLLSKESGLNDQISFIDKQLFDIERSGDSDTSKIAELKNRLFRLEKEKNDLALYLENNFSDYYHLKYTGNKITLADIRKKLAKDEAIVEYVLDRFSNENETESLFLFFITRDNFCLKKIPAGLNLSNDVKTVYQFLSDKDYINVPLKKYSDYVIAASNLYNLLVKPIEDKIENHKITVVPDGILSYIPFDALLYYLPPSDKLDFRNLPYLIKKYTFNYSYSANLMLNNFGKRKKAKEKIMAFAPAYNPGSFPANKEFNQLLPLIGIKDEVNAISKRIPTDLYADGQATESRFKSLCGQYDILHLAMHTILNDSLPMFSKLAFTPVDDSTGTNDGWLTTLEIYNLKLNSRMAVLSACNTGSGVLKEGEGVISLARGFMYAGCPSIVMTLWEVEDRSGASIMDEFYRLLKNGKRKHEALRLAKIHHIENADPVNAHPHFWLGYVTIGNTDALKTSNDFYFFVTILFVLLLVLADQVYKNKKARKNRAR